MTIRIHDRPFWNFERFIDFRKSLCHCSKPTCGATKPLTIGYTIYFWKYIISISYNKPNNCNFPF
jgi:hypothetical protein